MKKVAILSILFLLVTLTNKLQAQNNDSKIIVNKSDRIRYTEKENTVTYEGNASLSADLLTITNADKIVVDKGANKITVYGVCDFTFTSGLIRIVKTENTAKTLEYFIGERTVYLK